MRTLSATEAVKPAIARTKLLLFKPFRLGRSWKFAATAYVSTQGTFFLPFPLLAIFFLPLIHRTTESWVIWAVGPGIALLLALIVYIFMLCSRLQFPFMDVVMNRSVFIAPLWRQYGPQARRWTRAKMLIGTIVMFLLTIPIAVIVWFSYKGIPTVDAQSQQLPVQFGAVMGSIFLVYFGLILIVLIMSLINDFILPPLALEDAPVSNAWQSVLHLIRAEPGQIAAYAFFKILLGFIAQMACGILMEIVFFLLMFVLGLLGALLAMLLHAIHLPDIIFQIIAGITAAEMYLGFIGYAAPFANGVSIVFLEAYKLYFLGGRYAPLGDILDRTTPPPESPSPAPISGYVPIAPLPPSN
jgi:hypothetical protein